MSDTPAAIAIYSRFVRAVRELGAAARDCANRSGRVVAVYDLADEASRALALEHGLPVEQGDRIAVAVDPEGLEPAPATLRPFLAADVPHGYARAVLYSGTGYALVHLGFDGSALTVGAGRVEPEVPPASTLRH